MRFMIAVRASRESEAGVMPSERLLAEMGKYHEELQKAGLLIDGSGLKPSKKGWRIDYDGAKRSYVDGPFAETKELVAGYTIIRAKSREEAIAWTKRYPNPSINGGKAQIEVREFYQLEDFAPSRELERFEKMGLGKK